MAAEIQLGTGVDRKVIMTPIKAENPYPWDEVLNLIQTSFAYMESRIDPPSSMHSLSVENISEHSKVGEIWVIESDDIPIACMFLTPKAHALYLGKLAVSDTYRGLGLARKFIECATARAHVLGHNKLELETRIELTENHRAFEKMGFHKTDETAHAGYDRPTSITMQKELT
jgi:GNAT superfamily N-acetyltransferase